MMPNAPDTVGGFRWTDVQPGIVPVGGGRPSASTKARTAVTNTLINQAATRAAARLDGSRLGAMTGTPYVVTAAKVQSLVEYPRTQRAHTASRGRRAYDSGVATVAPVVGQPATAAVPALRATDRAWSSVGLGLRHAALRRRHDGPAKPCPVQPSTRIEDRSPSPRTCSVAAESPDRPANRRPVTGLVSHRTPFSHDGSAFFVIINDASPRLWPFFPR
jgi:hypothetical protein